MAKRVLKCTSNSNFWTSWNVCSSILLKVRGCAISLCSGFLHNHLDDTMPYRCNVNVLSKISSSREKCSWNEPCAMSHSLLVICFFQLLKDLDFVRTKFLWHVSYQTPVCRDNLPSKFSWIFFHTARCMFFVRPTTSRLPCCSKLRHIISYRHLRRLLCCLELLSELSQHFGIWRS